MDDDLGPRPLELGCVELLAVLELDEPERAALMAVGRLDGIGSVSDGWY